MTMPEIIKYIIGLKENHSKRIKTKTDNKKITKLRVEDLRND